MRGDRATRGAHHGLGFNRHEDEKRSDLCESLRASMRVPVRSIGPPPCPLGPVWAGSPAAGTSLRRSTRRHLDRSVALTARQFKDHRRDAMRPPTSTPGLAPVQSFGRGELIRQGLQLDRRTARWTGPFQAAPPGSTSIASRTNSRPSSNGRRARRCGPKHRSTPRRPPCAGSPTSLSRATESRRPRRSFPKPPAGHVRSATATASTSHALITNARVRSARVHDALHWFDELWCKLDAGTRSTFDCGRHAVPFVQILRTHERREGRSIVVQSMFLAHRGVGPTDAEIAAYVGVLAIVSAGGRSITSRSTLSPVGRDPEIQALPRDDSPPSRRRPGQG